MREHEELTKKKDENHKKRKRLLVVLLPVLALLLLLAVLLAVYFGTRPDPKKAVQGDDWTIYAQEEVRDAAETLGASMEETGVAKTAVTTELPESWSGRLILVGETEAEPSVEAVLTLGEEDFLVDFGKEYIVIAGGTPAKTAEAVTYVCENYMSYLSEYEDLPFGEEYNYLSLGGEGGHMIRQLLLNGVSVDRYQITAAGGENNEAAVFLQTVIENMTGVQLPVSESGTEDGYRIEIVSGGEGASKGLKEQQFGIYQEEGTLSLCAGDPDQELLAVKMLCAKYFEYDYINETSNAGSIDLENLDFTFTCSWEEFTAPKAAQARVLFIPPANGYSVMQGGCTDGTYAYYILNNQSFSPFVDAIYKVDLETLEVVKVSEDLALQHANSLTYNSRTKQLVVVNYDPDGTTLTYVDPETLAITGTTTVDFNALSLAYNEERDAYVAGTRGTFDFFLLDGNLKITDYCEAVQTKSVKQEVEVYQDKILFGMSGDNILYVYDWEGNFLYAIDLELYEEFENLIFHGDYAYTGYFSGGGIIYETIFYQELD